MSIQILATKLYVPPPRPKVILRPHLIEQLNDGLKRTSSVTLISAPVGYGKTTLVSEWVASCELPVAWLSLDQGDSDPTRFLTYLVSALQSISPNIGTGVLEILLSPQPQPTESILTALLNEITTFLDNFILVLDDYHLIEAKSVDMTLTFLLEHQPPHMHLVIATREDPNLPLARLRVRGQLTEVRATDLRFTPYEAADFLDQVMGLTLSTEDIAALETRTEGWIAGLQLAAITMQGQKDNSNFVKSFTGSNHFVVDYLVEEVLRQQPEKVRGFLLSTSILDRLCGPLCDALMLDSSVSGQETLEYLECANLFIVSLDNERHWYRYHHLFAEVLSVHLMAKQPDLVVLLHRRASEWYEQNGSAVDAIHHALVAEDFERAASLIERAVPAMRKTKQETTVFGWLNALPDEIIQCRPVLSVYFAGGLLLSGELEGVESRLQDAESWLDKVADVDTLSEPSPTKMVVVDEAEFRHLPGWIAIYRAASALVLGNVNNTLKYARQALDLVPEEDQLGRGAAAGLLGLAFWTSGDLESAHQSYSDSMVRLLNAGHVSDAIGCAIALADIRITQGRLREAMSCYERGLQLATEQGIFALRGAADMYVGMSTLHLQRGNLNAAMQDLMKSKELGEFAGLTQNPYRWRVAMASIQESQGDLGDALGMLNEAEGLYVSDFFPNVHSISAMKARIWVSQGRLGEAFDWVREKHLSVEDDLSYLLEFEHITMARVLLAQHQRDRSDHSILEIIGLLDRLLQSAEKGGRIGTVIEILVLQTLAQQMQNGIVGDLEPLECALTLAESEGYVRIFVKEGLPMVQLLNKAVARGIKSDYIGKLLAIFEAEKQKNKSKIQYLALSERHHGGGAISDHLSQRELEILRLISEGLSNREISKQLFLALNTVKGHNQKIFNKLDVQSRTEAIVRAHELGLL